MSLGMDPGQLRERVEILEERTVDDGQGGRSTNWYPIDSDWARIRPMPRSSRQKGGKTGSVAPFEVTMRYREDLTKSHRLAWEARDTELVLTSAPANLDEHSEYIVFGAAEFRD